MTVLDALDIVGTYSSAGEVYRRRLLAWLGSPEGRRQYDNQLWFDRVRQYPADLPPDSVSFLPLTNDEAAAWHQQHGELPPEVAEAYQEYSRWGHNRINQYLTDRVQSDWRGHVELMRSGMRGIHRSTLLYRATDFAALGVSGPEELVHRLSGEYFDPRFGSASVSHLTRVRDEFLKYPVWLEIEAPAGTPMMWNEPYSNNPFEQEMVLDAGLLYVPLRLTTQVFAGQTRYVLRVRVVGQDPPDLDRAPVAAAPPAAPRVGPGAPETARVPTVAEARSRYGVGPADAAVLLSVARHQDVTIELAPRDAGPVEVSAVRRRDGSPLSADALTDLVGRLADRGVPVRWGDEAPAPERVLRFEPGQAPHVIRPGAGPADRMDHYEPIPHTHFVAEARPPGQGELTDPRLAALLREAAGDIVPEEDFPGGQVLAVTPGEGGRVYVPTRDFGDVVLEFETGRLDPVPLPHYGGIEARPLAEPSYRSGPASDPHRTIVDERVADERVTLVLIHEIVHALRQREAAASGAGPDQPATEDRCVVARLAERAHLVRKLAATRSYIDAVVWHREISDIDGDLRARGVEPPPPVPEPLWSSFLPAGDSAADPARPEPSHPFRIAEDRGEPGAGQHRGGFWGRYGDTGVLVRHDTRYLLIRLGSQDRWRLPFAPPDERETPAEAAARGLHVRLGVAPEAMATWTGPGALVMRGPQGWKYTLLAAESPEPVELAVDPTGVLAAGWFTEAELTELARQGELHPALARVLPDALALYRPGEGGPRPYPHPRIATMRGYTRIGGHLGTTLGGLYRDPQGRQWYVKAPASELEAMLEILANDVLWAAGVRAPHKELVRLDDSDDTFAGRPIGIRSEIIQGTTDLEQHLHEPEFLARLHPDLPGLALVDNEDAVGLERFANVLFDEGGDRVWLDGGDALGMAAFSGFQHDGFSFLADAVDNRRNADRNLEAATVFQEASQDDLRAGTAGVAALTEEMIDEIVGGSGLPPGMVDGLAKTLKLRRQDLIRRFLTGDAAVAAVRWVRDTVQPLVTPYLPTEDLYRVLTEQVRIVRRSDSRLADMTVLTAVRLLDQLPDAEGTLERDLVDLLTSPEGRELHQRLQSLDDALDHPRPLPPDSARFTPLTVDEVKSWARPAEPWPEETVQAFQDFGRYSPVPGHQRPPSAEQVRLMSSVMRELPRDTIMFGSARLDDLGLTPEQLAALTGHRFRQDLAVVAASARALASELRYDDVWLQFELPAGTRATAPSRMSGRPLPGEVVLEHGLVFQVLQVSQRFVQQPTDQGTSPVPRYVLRVRAVDREPGVQGRPAGPGAVAEELSAGYGFDPVDTEALRSVAAHGYRIDAVRSASGRVEVVDARHADGSRLTMDEAVRLADRLADRGIAMRDPGTAPPGPAGPVLRFQGGEMPREVPPPHPHGEFAEPIPGTDFEAESLTFGDPGIRFLLPGLLHDAVHAIKLDKDFADGRVSGIELHGDRTLKVRTARFGEQTLRVGTGWLPWIRLRHQGGRWVKPLARTKVRLGTWYLPHKVAVNKGIPYNRDVITRALLHEIEHMLRALERRAERRERGWLRGLLAPPPGEVREDRCVPARLREWEYVARRYLEIDGVDNFGYWRQLGEIAEDLRARGVEPPPMPKRPEPAAPATNRAEQAARRRAAQALLSRITPDISPQKLFGELAEQVRRAPQAHPVLAGMPMLGALRLVDRDHALERALVDWLGTPEGRYHQERQTRLDAMLARPPALPPDSLGFVTMTAAEVESWSAPGTPWTDETIEAVRRHVRFEHLPSYHHHPGHLRQRENALIHRAMRPLDRDTLLFTATTWDDLGLTGPQDLADLPGTVIEPESFQAVSPDPATVGHFRWRNDPVVLEIEAAAGTRAARTDQVFSAPNRMPVLLDRFQPYEVLRVAERVDGDVTRYVVRVRMNGAPSPFQVVQAMEEPRDAGSVPAGLGSAHGVAGLVLRHVDTAGVDRYLLVQRESGHRWQWPWTPRYSTPGSKETSAQAAARLMHQEFGMAQADLDTLD